MQRKHNCQTTITNINAMSILAPLPHCLKLPYNRTQIKSSAVSKPKVSVGPTTGHDLQQLPLTSPHRIPLGNHFKYFNHYFIEKLLHIYSRLFVTEL
jgi:hypothetical protein